MKLTIILGCTATKVGDKKPTRFYGGETEDIRDEDAAILLKEECALRANTKEAKEALKAMPTPNPKTRRQDLDAETPGLAESLAVKAAVKEAKKTARSKTAMLGEKLNGGKASEE